MSRLMSVALTEQAVRDRRKTVTRRLGWRMLKPGDHLTLCRKVMGRRKDEPLIRICEVEVVDVRRERSGTSRTRTSSERVSTSMSGRRPIPWTLLRAREVQPDTEVTRVEWRYLS